MEASGQLNAAIEDAENRAFDVKTATSHQNLNPDQARELTREEWCLPAEEDEPETREGLHQGGLARDDTPWTRPADRQKRQRPRRS